MGGFKLDTSGAVIVERGSVLTKYRWSDLSPFAQGYIKRALDGQKVPAAYDGLEPVRYRPVRFSDLAPATLAAMLWDCERYLVEWKHPSLAGAGVGRLFWQARQKWVLPSLPPVTLYVADDGKVHQREGAADV